MAGTHPDDSPEEDALLDEMDRAWHELTREEREWLNRNVAAPKR